MNTESPGPVEREILEEAKERKEAGKLFRASKGTSRASLKRLVKKGWMDKTSTPGVLFITREGEKVLQGKEHQDQAGLGDFS